MQVNMVLSYFNSTKSADDTVLSRLQQLHALLASDNDTFVLLEAINDYKTLFHASLSPGQSQQRPSIGKTRLSMASSTSRSSQPDLVLFKSESEEKTECRDFKKFVTQLAQPYFAEV